MYDTMANASPHVDVFSQVCTLRPPATLCIWLCMGMYVINEHEHEHDIQRQRRDLVVGYKPCICNDDDDDDDEIDY